ncbi:MAG TPA: NPCBM/NEW2 domain-containing protein, partial [Blastocatellia bacterium]
MTIRKLTSFQYTFLKTLTVILVIASMLLPMMAKSPGIQSENDFRATDAPAGAIWLESLDLTKMSQDWGVPRAGRSVGNKPLTMKGVVYPHGVGTHAVSDMLVNLKGAATKFAALAGVDEETLVLGSVDFEIWVDGKKVADSGVMRGAGQPKVMVADLRGARQMELIVNDAGDGIDNDHADWAGAMIFLAPGGAALPVAISAAVEPAPPIRPADSRELAIHGPMVTGVSPGKPFLFLVPATGRPPLRFSATGMPDGLTLDRTSGIISGTISGEGSYLVHLQVRGPDGANRRDLTIVCKDHPLALTPPMGWNSWNVWAGSVDEQKVRAAADW